MNMEIARNIFIAHYSPLIAGPALADSHSMGDAEAGESSSANAKPAYH